MQLHHSKHHATYVNNLNVAEEKLQEAVAKSKLVISFSLNKVAYDWIKDADMIFILLKIINTYLNFHFIGILKSSKHTR